ncbi:NBR1-Ig-like domain-containing protein [Planotetraspora phitsanulokensis]|uniref:Nbr1 FW domain-containing protein n=1 Tax=Planotetraspora phitsanulokensis TaxID=575192 RepID=A0A8J3UFN6_9ACTN|nr:NBR1-Ig-like domain-containing protein [Planotetraspora phitsanulokensis]GII42436.1 hypothetical protein Pph01_74390 [Planotetraspora phitsanulokensis]
MRDAVSGKRERQERFAKELRGLRAEAGNPSFRVMAARSRSVSHATLHEAAKGTRFPSWLTTEAFVEACGGDVDDWRARWREALGEPAATLEARTAVTESEPSAPEPDGDVEPANDSAPEPDGDVGTANGSAPETGDAVSVVDGTANEHENLPDEPIGTAGVPEPARVPRLPVPPGDGTGDAPADGASADGAELDGVPANTVSANTVFTNTVSADRPDHVAETPDVPSRSAPATGDPEPPVEPVPVRRPPGRHRRTALIVAGCAAALAAAGASVYLQSHDQRTPARAKPGPEPTAMPAATSSEGMVPRIAGDKSVFVGDVTIPDGTVMEPGQQFTKTWEIANIGTVPWHGRFLERAQLPADNGTCSTPSKVPIPDTEPGAHVRISVTVMAPDSPGSCWVGWKMVDGEDHPFLPGSRPIYFVVNVAG